MTASRESRGVLRHRQVLALFGVQVGLEGQLRHAEDAVHGRADFVAHVGQEVALGAVGLFGRKFGFDQLDLHLLALVDLLAEFVGALIDALL